MHPSKRIPSKNLANTSINAAQTRRAVIEDHSF